jgi:hypothetical protein
MKTEIIPMLMLLGCTTEPGASDKGADDSGPLDTSAADDSGITMDTGESYNGSFPEARIPAPEFAALNRDGTTRGQPDLIGHPSVLWFYPAANTSG